MGKRRVKKAKKAAALSLETVAVAAIVLVVLIIVIAIFKGGVGNISKSVSKVNECNPSDCHEQGKCSSGQEIYGLGCDKFVAEKVNGATGPYCCKTQQKTGQDG